MITQNSTIGFIGLGAMGQRMAHRLLDRGFRLMAYDHTISRPQSSLPAEQYRRPVFKSSPGNRSWLPRACQMTKRF
jgi:6-phosphogluconate dehydrogenase